MGKKQNDRSVKNRHLYSRVSFLYQAAVHLREAAALRIEDHGVEAVRGMETYRKFRGNRGMARRLATDLRVIALKTQIRLSPTMKGKICRGCDGILIDGLTCSVTVENKSKGGWKSWADVMVWTCKSCKREKRYPVSAPRQVRRSYRHAAPDTKTTSPATALPTDTSTAG
jgi:ribonuclease P protein subunit RPR2